MAVLVGSHASAAGDGTQHTSSSRGAVGWRRTETRGRPLHEIEECAARLVVAGPLWARSRAGSPRPWRSTSRRRSRSLLPRPRPSPLPRPCPSPSPFFSTLTRLLASFCAECPAQPTLSGCRLSFVVAHLRVLIRNLDSPCGLPGTETAIRSWARKPAQTRPDSARRNRDSAPVGLELQHTARKR